MKCPLRAFQNCDKTCAWFRYEGCAIVEIANSLCEINGRGARREQRE